MKQLTVFIAIFGCMAFLTACHADEKQATNIQEKMKKAASYEKEFTASQEDLETYREKEQSVYNDLLDLDIEDTDTIHDKMDDGNTYLKKQEERLKEGKENFQKAYKKSSSIEKNVKKIKDEKQKKQASDLMKTMKKRKKTMDSFFKHYQEQLNLLNSFYDYLEDDEQKIDEMSEQIDQMNKNNENIENIVQKFNDDTKEYNEEEAKYYKMVDIA